MHNLILFEEKCKNFELMTYWTFIVLLFKSNTYYRKILETEKPD